MTDSVEGLIIVILRLEMCLDFHSKEEVNLGWDHNDIFLVAKDSLVKDELDYIWSIKSLMDYLKIKS